ncbi:hypothetical protein FQA47_022838 [Oryzias melastigma]|uniref:Uncharacterized protein n=1 Tax=Oryzias melastigma TaxID=30732 RepID=A0A834CA67_ORYME|nr:hypothetical protein FQA47_022838 [Oryzias melastigma]
MSREKDKCMQLDALWSVIPLCHWKRSCKGNRKNAFTSQQTNCEQIVAHIFALRYAEKQLVRSFWPCAGTSFFFFFWLGECEEEEHAAGGVPAPPPGVSRITTLHVHS